jgi:hypothetical protein
MLASVVEYVLRAANGIAEAELDDQGSAKAGHSGFYVSQNSERRTVLIEALGFSQSVERQYLARYQRAIGNALRATLTVDPEEHVQIDSRGMVRVHSLSDEQIGVLKRRYSH